MKKRRAVEKEENKLEYLVYIVSIVFLAWCLLSFVDVNMNNDGGAIHYWNLFQMLFGK